MRSGAYLVAVALPLFGVALFAAPQPAAACGKGTCQRGYFAPQDGVTIPANSPALVIARTFPPESSPLATITTDAGATVVLFMATADTYPRVLRLQTPLEAGKTYAVTHYQSCLPDASAGNAQLTFLAGPDAPLPTSSGIIAVAQAGVDPAYEVGGSSACTMKLRAAVVRFAFTSTDELTPYLGITRFRFAIDGATGSSDTDFGVDPNAVVKGPYFDRSVIELFGSCPGSEARGLALGTHTWSWQAEIAGVETLPAPTTGTFELTCTPADGGNLGGAGGAGGSTAAASGASGSSSGPAGAGDAGSNGGAASALPSGQKIEPVEQPDSGSCSCRTSAPKGPRYGFVAWLVGLGVVGAHRASRRRAPGVA